MNKTLIASKCLSPTRVPLDSRRLRLAGAAANPRQPIPPTADTLMSSLLGAAREVAVAGAAVGGRAWSWAARCRILEPRWDPPPQPQSELGAPPRHAAIRLRLRR
jgi:hypothetical protein